MHYNVRVPLNILLLDYLLKMQQKSFKFVLGDISPLRIPNKEAMGAEGGIAFSTH